MSHWFILQYGISVTLLHTFTSLSSVAACLVTLSFFPLVCSQQISQITVSQCKLVHVIHCTKRFSFSFSYNARDQISGLMHPRQALYY
jgi:hypothetical protein